jgi:hypothetical protein
MRFSPDLLIESPRLWATVVADTHVELQVCDRRYLSESSMAAICGKPDDDPVQLEEITAAKIAS